MNAPTELSETQTQRLDDYIRRTWKDLTRSPEHLLDLVYDPKVPGRPEQRQLVYLSAIENPDKISQSLSDWFSSDALNQLEIRVLPGEAEMIKEHGLLFLPGLYVVPGGRFNELYGWDSFFILLGLIRHRQWDLAFSQTNQLLYEIDHYGMVLNANRTYYLGRSNPPFLSQMVRRLYHVSEDKEWLQKTLPSLELYYSYWTVPPHLNQATGLSRFYALNEGPAPEVVYSERDSAGRTHYDRVREFYRNHYVSDYDASEYYNRVEDRLTDMFYKSDRSMRESGFDPSHRFGMFSAEIVHYAPVCLNVLLYLMEQDLGEFHQILGDQKTAKEWKSRAKDRAQRINHFLWDEEAGLYFDYNFRTGQRRPYEFLTTFYPLWAGIASKEQAARVWEHLPRFEGSGGLRTSLRHTGCQWDAPFGWAPLHWIAIQGLRNYSFNTDADRIRSKWLGLIMHEFEKTGLLLEKYDVEQQTSEFHNEIQFGYVTNEPGFGWTNGVAADLLNLTAT